jgi:hypothetical protein
VQLLDGIQVSQRGVDSLIRFGVDDQGLLLSYGTSFPRRAGPASELRAKRPPI